MPLMTNLYKAPSGRYFYRRVVPEALRASIGRREIKIALDTQDPEEAKRRQPGAHQQANRLLDVHRRATPSGEACGLRNGASGAPAPQRKLSIAAINAMACRWRDKRIAEGLFHMTVLRPIPKEAQLARAEAADYRKQALNREFTETVKNDARKCLEEAGIAPGDIAEDSEQFLLVCYAVLLATADWMEAEAQWLSGNTTYFPTNPVLPLPPEPADSSPIVLAGRPDMPTPSLSAITLSPPSAPRGNTPLEEVVDRWFREKPDMSGKTKHECRMVFRRLGEIVGGNPPIGSIDQVKVLEFKEALVCMPRSLPQSERLLPLPEIAKRYKDEKYKDLRISSETVTKQIGLLQSFFGWAERHKYVTENLAAGLKPNKPKRGMRRRIPFTGADLQQIFGSPLYRGYVSTRERTRPGSLLLRDEYFWLPLLALFTGGRLEELGSLLLSEVKLEEGIMFLELDVLELDDSEETESDEAMKSQPSLRSIPVHSLVLACGFAEYVADLRRRGQTRLFPNLRPDRFGKFTARFSKWFGRFLNAIGIIDRRKVFHSFRHNFKAACRNANLREDVHDRLTGHRNNSVGRQYGEDIPMCVLTEAVEKIQYTGLDLMHLFQESKKA